MISFTARRLGLLVPADAPTCDDVGVRGAGRDPVNRFLSIARCPWPHSFTRFYTTGPLPAAGYRTRRPKSRPPPVPGPASCANTAHALSLGVEEGAVSSPSPP